MALLTLALSASQFSYSPSDKQQAVLVEFRHTTGSASCWQIKS